MTNISPFKLISATIDGQINRQNWTAQQKLEIADIVFEQLKHLDRCNLDPSVPLVGCAGAIRYVKEIVKRTDEDSTMYGFFDELVFAYPSQTLHPNSVVTNSLHYMGMNWHDDPYARMNLIDQIHNRTLFDLIFDSCTRRALQAQTNERTQLSY